MHLNAPKCTQNTLYRVKENVMTNQNDEKLFGEDPLLHPTEKDLHPAEKAQKTVDIVSELMNLWREERLAGTYPSGETILVKQLSKLLEKSNAEDLEDPQLVRDIASAVLRSVDRISERENHEEDLRVRRLTATVWQEEPEVRRFEVKERRVVAIEGKTLYRNQSEEGEDHGNSSK